VNSENDTINCKVIKLKKGKLKFTTNSKKYKIVKEDDLFDDLYSDSSSLPSESKYKFENIDNLKKISLSNESVIYNPLNLKIEDPEEGYAHIYFFRPYVYLNSALGCKIKYGDKKFLNIKTNGYYLHKVKAGEKYKFYKSRIGKDNVVEINAENKKIYYIRAILGAVNITNMVVSSLGGMPMVTGGRTSITLDDSPNAQYHVLSMKKKLKRY